MSADVSLLAGVPLFKLLDEEERCELARHVEVVHVPTGQHVYRHGDPGDSIYIIRRGKVEIYHSSNDGKKIMLESPGVGDYFGELSFLDNGSRSASVKVTENLEAIVLDREDLHRLIHSHPHAALDMLTSIGTRFRKMIELLQSANTRNPNEEFADKRTLVERTADWIAAFSGSIPFLGIHAVWFVIWVAINVGFVPGVPAFDPYPFGLLTMIVSLEAIFLSVFVLLSQNRQVEKDRLRSDVEYEVNLRAELEINHLHTKIDRVSSELLTRYENLHRDLQYKNSHEYEGIIS